MVWYTGQIYSISQSICRTWEDTALSFLAWSFCPWLLRTASAPWFLDRLSREQAIITRQSSLPTSCGLLGLLFKPYTRDIHLFGPYVSSDFFKASVLVAHFNVSIRFFASSWLMDMTDILISWPCCAFSSFSKGWSRCCKFDAQLFANYGRICWPHK